MKKASDMEAFLLFQAPIFSEYTTDNDVLVFRKRLILLYNPRLAFSQR